MALVNQQWLLASRPAEHAGLDNFRLVQTPVPALADGQVLVRQHYLSLDPYMRMRMNEGKSYAAPQAVGAVMLGGTVGEVLESRHPGFAAGDAVVGAGGWQQYALVQGPGLAAWRKVDVSRVPLAAYLGAVGMPGVTAWVGLSMIIAPKAGETIAVSAASGAVGSALGQLAKARGCRVVGIAGGPEKCAYVVDELGFDACVDHKQHRDAAALAAALKQAAPGGIDGNFENVGGPVLDAVLANMNDFGRIALCGMIAGYDGRPLPITQPRLLLTARLKLQGFIVSEHPDLWPAALRELGERVASGELKYRESIAQGIERAPQAFLDLLQGKNFGKQLVKLV
ncbi:MAG: NADP-dependent oxidoreductase [Proteobacteria bacterium]|nr:NADP-dependent oxidoreductase [Pseudomonadota bacterium]